ncbi:arginine--tRNA ligase [Candidatus Woesearchaeota archaeon]|nr:arginine--tRNA ligase [Candidatus Woesearchaeota archaeon]
MIFEAVNKLVREQLGLKDFQLQTPKAIEHGDVSLPCFSFSKEFKKSPHVIAEEFAKNVTPRGLVKSVSAIAGFLNFHINKQELAKLLLPVIDDKYGRNNAGKKRIVVVEYSSPNIAKPFGVGHLRSTVIGASIAKLYEFHGWKVIRMNHLGDWGTQFGKLIVAFKRWGVEKRLNEEPIKHLLEIYVAFHTEAEQHPEIEEDARQAFAELERGNKEYKKLWKKFVNLSIKEFKKIYAQLNVNFDYEYGESFYSDKMQAVIDLAESKSVSERNDGALIIPLEGMPPVLLLKSNSSTTYHTRDMASAIYRIEKLKSERLVYVVGQEQILHFNQVFGALGKLGYDTSDMHHIPFGLFHFKDGKMSTRKGNVIFLEEILEEAKERVLALIKEKNPSLKNKEDVAKKVGIGSIIFGDLQNDRIKEIVFDWDRIIDLQGDTGPYIHYTYARIMSILRKSKNSKKRNMDYSKLLHPVEEKIISLLEQYPSVIGSALDEHHPHIVAQYLLKLCRSFNEFYHDCKVMGSPEEVERLMLICSVGKVIKSGLDLLGIETVEEM